MVLSSGWVRSPGAVVRGIRNHRLPFVMRDAQSRPDVVTRDTAAGGMLSVAYSPVATFARTASASSFSPVSPHLRRRLRRIRRRPL